MTNYTQIFKNFCTGALLAAATCGVAASNSLADNYFDSGKSPPWANKTTFQFHDGRLQVTPYGILNLSLLDWDTNNSAAPKSHGTHTVDPDTASTRLGIKIKYNFSSGFSTALRVEYEFQLNPSNLINEFNSRDGCREDRVDDIVCLRRADWYVGSPQLGMLSIGRGDMTTSGLTEIDLSGTNVIGKFGANHFMNEFEIGNTFERWGFVMIGNQEFEQQNRVRYDSPTFAGFTVSSAWGEDDYWDVALRYAGEFGAIRVAAGVGYGHNGEGPIHRDQPIDNFKENFIGGSASIMHVPTGLFISGAFRALDGDGGNPAADQTDTSTLFYGKIGVADKFFSIGKTALYAEYHQYDDSIRATCGGGQGSCFADGTGANIWGAGVVQNIDAAAMQLYLGYRNYKADTTDSNDPSVNENDASTLIAGARIKF